MPEIEHNHSTLLTLCGPGCPVYELVYNYYYALAYDPGHNHNTLDECDIYCPSYPGYGYPVAPPPPPPPHEHTEACRPWNCPSYDPPAHVCTEACRPWNCPNFEYPYPVYYQYDVYGNGNDYSGSV
jgi:hypothetical protein